MCSKVQALNVTEIFRLRDNLIFTLNSDKSIYLLTYMRVFGFGFVTGKLPKFVTKPDLWHLGLNLEVILSYTTS